MSDFADFLAIQTQTAWGRTLADFAEWCRPQPGWRALDIGTGPGVLPALFSERGCSAFGVDKDPSLLKGPFQNSHAILLAADAYQLPLPLATFDLITATNVLFLLGDPLRALLGWARLLAPSGAMCLLNPSERLSVESAAALADSRGLTGKNRESLLGWALRAEKHIRWTEEEMAKLYARAGMTMIESTLKVGPGFARFSRANRAQ